MSEERDKLIKWVLSKGRKTRVRLQKQDPKLLEVIDKAFAPIEIHNIFIDEYACNDSISEDENELPLGGVE